MTVCAIKMGDRVFYCVGEYAQVIQALIEEAPLTIFEAKIGGEIVWDQITFFQAVDWCRTEAAIAAPVGNELERAPDRLDMYV